MLQACSAKLTLEIPEKGFETVQYTHANDRRRAQNTLDISPIEISNNEFNSIGLSVNIDSKYTARLRTAGVGIAPDTLQLLIEGFELGETIEEFHSRKK